MLTLKARLAAENAAALATRRALEDMRAGAQPEGSVSQGQGRFRLSSVVQESLTLSCRGVESVAPARNSVKLVQVLRYVQL